ncbi:hypothetical protein H6P81_016915 [Aristolochia fimbriata]|uniref:Uncharacterized protein n=1 Tax=Aristolochia fimbriata TaxID=158543 RepID=A0AAV7DZQ7_ARIFI|nr:hypothetical protein H6P81_016915 [Aristolochia fimbriata]
MSMLEIITKAISAVSDHQKQSAPSKFPIILNADNIFPQLKPETNDSDESPSIKKVVGWEISSLDSQIMDSTAWLVTKLKRKLKASKSFTTDEFLKLLNFFLKKCGENAGISIEVQASEGSKYSSRLIEKHGAFIGPELAGLIAECCVALEVWDLLETLILQRLIKHSSFGNLIVMLIEKKKSHLLTLCVKSATDLQPSDLLAILKYFLAIDSCGSMKEVKEEWEAQERTAIDKVIKKKTPLNKQVAIQLMAANDGFSGSEKGLHYLFTSINTEDAALSWAIGELEGPEVIKLVRYLTKWLDKYEKFPQLVGAASKGISEASKGVPSLESVVMSAGMIMDEHFSYLVLQREFYDELRIFEEKVKILVEEAKLCSDIADMIEILRSQED